MHFTDGTNVPRKDKVKYLGCDINEKTHAGREVRKRIGETIAILTQKTRSILVAQRLPDQGKNSSTRQ